MNLDWHIMYSAAVCQPPWRTLSTVLSNGPATPQYRRFSTDALSRVLKEQEETSGLKLQDCKDHGSPEAWEPACGERDSTRDGSTLPIQSEGADAPPPGLIATEAEQAGEMACHWAHHLVNTTFFFPCSQHPGTSLKNKCNFFCPDLGSTLCQECVGDLGGRHGKCLQVYRYMYNDVIRVDDFEELLDLQGIQPYMANNHQAVHLRPWELSKGKSPAGFTQRCEGGCGRNLSSLWSFCSLACKMAAARGVPLTPREHAHACSHAVPADARHSTHDVGAGAGTTFPPKLSHIPTPSPAHSRSAFENRWMAAARGSHSVLSAEKGALAEMLFASVKVRGGDMEQPSPAFASSKERSPSPSPSPSHSPSPFSHLKRGAGLGEGSPGLSGRRSAAATAACTPPAPPLLQLPPSQKQAHALAKASTLRCSQHANAAQRGLTLQQGLEGAEGCSPRKRVRKLVLPQCSPAV